MNSNEKQSITARVITALLAVLAGMILIVAATEASFAETNYVEVGTSEELNQALGGGHTVDGDKVILQHDVTTDKSLDIYKVFIIDLNGHDITETNEGKQIDNEYDRCRYDSSLFNLYGRLTIGGNGTVKTTKEHSDIFHIISGAVTVNGGTYITEAKNSFPVSMGEGSVAINDGKFESHNAEGLPTTITQADDFYPSRTRGYSQSISIRGGSVQSIMGFYENDLFLRVNGGEIDRIVMDESRKITFEMNGGTIKAGASLDAQVVFNGEMNGGMIQGGGGLKIFGGAARSTFEMNGGTLCSGYLFPLAVKQNRSKKNLMIVALRGGKLIQKGYRTGLKLIGNVKTTIYGTSIIADGETKLKEPGIQASDAKVLKWKVSPKVKFAGRYYAKKDTCKIKGFKYAYKRSAKSKFTIKKGVKLKTSKKTYIYKSKLPNSIKGNVTAK